MFAPARTPAAVIDRLNAEVGKILARTDVQKNFLSAGLEPKAMLPDETRKFVLADIERWGKLVKSVNLNPH
jgi:tripartite-type tricarboxylate transporter receptor subunit TctC